MATCIGVLTPCPSGDPIYIRLGLDTTSFYSAWLAFLNSSITIDAVPFTGITWYFDSICCDDGSCPNYESYSALAVPAPDPNKVTIFSSEPCNQTTIDTCCALLTNCVTNETLYVTVGQSGSLEYVGWSALVDTLITDDTETYSGTWHVDGICCTQAEVDPCNTPNSCSLGSVLLSYLDTTNIGSGACPPVCYKITNCKTTIFYYTFTNLYAYVNSVITVEEYDGCWLVELSEGCTEFNTVEVTLIQGYDDCLCCLGPEPPKYTRIVPAPNRVFYKTPSQCDIRTNTQFANAYYRMFKNLKYGINSECDVNIEKITIKKELADLAATYYLPACGQITVEPTPIICPEPS